MLSARENERLTRVGPGTPMGELLRRYWLPFAASDDLETVPLREVRLLAEDLQLAGSAAEGRALRGADGQAYPVQELGGLAFAYLGPEPAPLLPRWDLFTWRDGVVKQIGHAIIPCNWLQIMENSVDPYHGEWLHGRYMAYVAQRAGKADDPSTQRLNRRHVKVGYDVFEHGIVKRRVLEGQSEDEDDWRIGHPLLFPNALKVGGNSRYEFQIRVPLDDTHTWHVWYQVLKPPPEVPVPVQDVVPAFEMPYRHDDGRYMVEHVNGQDIMVWITQGDIVDRSQEQLGTSDRGVILYRLLLQEQLERVREGEDPLGVVRDPANNVAIHLATEEDKYGAGPNAARKIFRTWRTRNTPQVQEVIDRWIAYSEAAHAQSAEGTAPRPVS